MIRNSSEIESYGYGYKSSGKMIGFKAGYKLLTAGNSTVILQNSMSNYEQFFITEYASLLSISIAVILITTVVNF
jgi:hypothetical protein